MIEGTIAEYDEYHVRVTPSGVFTDTGDDPFPLDALFDVYTNYASNGDDVEIGIWLHAETNDITGTPSHGFRLRIPLLDYDSALEGENFTGSGTGWGTEGRVVFYDFKLYVSLSAGQPIWNVEWSDIKWFVGGGEHTAPALAALSPGSVSSGYFTPAGIPLIGIPATIAGGGGTRQEYANWATLETVPDYNCTLSATATGGWKFRHDGDDIIFDCLLDKGELPVDPTCGTSSSRPSFSASDTWSSSVTGHFSIRSFEIDYGAFECAECPPGYNLITPGEYQPVGVFVREESSGSGGSAAVGGTFPSLTLIPAVGRAYIRLGENNKAMVYRGGFPAADAYSQIVCHNYSRDDSCDPTEEVESSSTNRTDRLYNPASDFLGFMGQSASGMEDVLGGVAKCLYSEAWSTLEFQSFIQGIHSVNGDCEEPGNPLHNVTVCCYEGEHYRFEYIATSAFPITSYPLSGFFTQLSHANDAADYINTHCSPHWAYFLYFPEIITGTGWGIENTPTYWLPMRTQWLGNNAVFGGSITPKTRNHIITEPLASGQLATHVGDFYMGVDTSWLGISRFETALQSTVTTPLTTVSEPAWTFTDCTAAFAAGGITLTPTGGATDLVADYDLGNFDQEPFMFPHLAKSIYVDWVNTNIVGVTVKLINQDDDEITLGTVKDTTYSKPVAVDDKFAGSWAQDFIADEGVDIGAAGISAATLADTERAHSYSLFGGFDAKTLRFEIEVASPAATCELEYPRFTSGANYPVPYLSHETGQFSAMVWANAPLLRWGQHNYWDVGGEVITKTPSLRVPGELSTEIDGLAFLDQYFGGVEAGTTGTVFSPNEYGSDDVNRTIGTHSFILPVTSQSLAGMMEIALVNSLRECPPLIQFPRELLPLSGITSLVSGYGLWSYVQWQNVNKYLSAKAPIKMMELASNTDWCNTQSEAVTNWWVSTHEHPVDNGEVEADFEVTVGDTAYANATPWHGYSAVLAPSREGSGVAITRDIYNNHYIAFVSGDSVFCRTTNFKTLDVESEVIEDADADRPSICWHPLNCVIVVWDDGSSISGSLNYGQGKAGFWTGTPLAIDSGTHCAIVADQQLGTIYLAYHDGTNFVMNRYQNLSDFVSGDFDGPYTIVNESAGACGIERGMSSERWLVFVYTDSGGDLQRLFSYDNGATWG